MRTTRSTDGRSTRATAPRLRVAGAAVALVASSAVTAGVIRAIPPSADVGHESVCGATENDTSNVGTLAVQAFGVGCDDDLRAVYHLSQAWPQKRAASKAPSGDVHVEPSPDQAATWTAIALAESGGSTGT